MPFRKVQASQKAREASLSRSSHSPSRQAMGNRQLVPSAPPGRGRNSSLTRSTKRNGVTLNKAVVDVGFQKKSSSGGVTTVGSLIPFQRASRREPHVEPQVNEGDRNGPNKKTLPKKTPADDAQNHCSDKHDDENSNPNSSTENGISSTSDTKTLPLSNNQKIRPANLQGGRSQARSVRPKVKRPSVPKEHINTASSNKTSNSVGATIAVSGANDRGQTEVEVVSVSTTSPRRRVVRQKSQTPAAERKSDNNEGHASLNGNEKIDPQRIRDVPVSSSEFTSNGDSPQDAPISSHVGNSSESSRPLSRTRTRPLHQSLPENWVRPELAFGNDIARHNLNEESEDISRLNSSRTLSRSRAQPLNQSLPETQLRTFDNDNARQNSNGESVNNSSNNIRISAEMLPRPLSSARVPLRTSSSRNGENQSRFETGRPTIQPAPAVATDLHESSNSLITDGLERQPNSVRRSLERLGSGQDRSNLSERPRLARQNVSGVTSRARQREMIDVNSAVSQLTTRVPQSPGMPSGPVGTNSRNEAALSRIELDTTPSDEDVWVPRIRPDSRNSVSSSHEQTLHSSTNLPLSSEPSGILQRGQSDTPDVVFRDSPVTGLLHRRHSRLSSSSDNDTYPSVRNTTRNAPSIPSRRGLYRALSVNTETTDESSGSEISRNTLASQNQRETRTYSRIENIDSEDVVSWRQIEMEHSYPAREPRQRLIYQDRSRGRETILNHNTSGNRIVPPSMDSVPDIADEQEFPPLGNASSTSRGVGNGPAQGQASSSSGQEYGFTARNRRSETPPPTPTPGRNPSGDRSSEDDPIPMMDHLVLLASPIFGPLMLQASPAVLFNMLSRARRDFGGEFVELLIENVVLSLLAQHTFDAANHAQNNGGAPPPASQDTIESLEKVTVTKKMVSEEAFCSICHCEYMLEETLDQLPCKHNFHSQCITVWLKKSGTCPVCRHKLYTDSVE